MMAPVFSREAWRCSWYMIQVTFWLSLFWYIYIRLKVLMLSVFDAE